MAKCKVGEILSAVEDSKKELDAFSTALQLRQPNGNYVWSAKTLAHTVSNNTRFSVGATTVKEHRRASCGCFL